MNEKGFTVKIFGCTNAEITVNQEKISLKEISEKVNLPADTKYSIRGKQYNPHDEIKLYEHIELECISREKKEPIYHVKVFGCTHKELVFTKPTVILREVSKKAEIPEDTLYVIDGKSYNSSSEIKLTDGIELECKKLGRDS